MNECMCSLISKKALVMFVYAHCTYPFTTLHQTTTTHNRTTTKYLNFYRFTASMMRLVCVICMEALFAFIPN